MKKSLFLAFFSTSLVGCATFPPTIPPGYTGPTAKIFDGGAAEGSTKGKLFYIDSIDGQPVYSSVLATRRASSGQGFYLSMVYQDHVIPAKPMKLKLVGSHITAAPIHEMASRMAGTFFRVEGEVAFNPLPGHSYFVTGKLEKGGSSVWVADSDAESVPVTEIVNSAEK